MSTSLSKRLGRATARWGMFLFYGMFKYFPYWFVMGFSRIALPIGLSLTVRHKRVARQSLETAFGQEKSSSEREAIVKKCFANGGKNMVELVYYISHPEKTKDVFSVEGQEHLDNALAQGKGVVAVTAHFGNFPLMMLYCATMGYNVSTILRPVRDKKLESFLSRKRRETNMGGIYAVPRRKCITDSLKKLRDNGILFIPLDQNHGDRGGVYVDFFGKKAATATGPVVYAKRTGALIVPMFVVREGKDRHKIYIEPPMELEEKEGEDQTVIYNTAKITKIIESYIRRFPHEWGWMHKRWKSKPSRNHKQVIRGEL